MTPCYRSFENIAGCEAIRPDIAGIMGAFGAALIARERYHVRQSQPCSPWIRSLNLTYSTVMTRCGRLQQQLRADGQPLRGGRQFITGNRCERGLGETQVENDIPNLFKYKFTGIFDYEPLPADKAPRGVVGIPRVLNMYENYPFWATFLRELGFRVRAVAPVQPARSTSWAWRPSPASRSAIRPSWCTAMWHGSSTRACDLSSIPASYMSARSARTQEPLTTAPWSCPTRRTSRTTWRSWRTRNIVQTRLWPSPMRHLTERLVKVICEELRHSRSGNRRGRFPKAWAELHPVQGTTSAEEGRGGHRLSESRDRQRGIVLAGRPYHWIRRSTTAFRSSSPPTDWLCSPRTPSPTWARWSAR